MKAWHLVLALVAGYFIGVLYPAIGKKATGAVGL